MFPPYMRRLRCSRFALTLPILENGEKYNSILYSFVLLLNFMFLCLPESLKMAQIHIAMYQNTVIT